MKVLTASTGARSDDFSATVAGELAYPGLVVCGRDREGPGDCGCGRSFVGIASGAATTVVLVEDRDVTVEQLADMLHTTLTAAGWNVDRDWAYGLAADVADEAASWPEGTRLRRLVDEIGPE